MKNIVKEVRYLWFQRVTDILKDYLDFSHDPRYYNLLGLWIVGTYVYHDIFKTFPQLFLEGSFQSGKSQTLELCSYLSAEGEFVSRITAASLRDLSNLRRSLFIDEFETVHGEIETILRAGYKAGGRIIKMVRVEGDWVPKSFEVYSPKMFASTQPLNVINESRTIKVRTYPSSDPAIIGRPVFRLKEWEELRGEIEREMAENKDPIESAYKKLSGSYDGVQFRGRERELWDPMLALSKFFNALEPTRKLAVDLVQEARVQTLNSSPDHIVLMAVEELVVKNTPDWIRGKEIRSKLLEITEEPPSWATPKSQATTLRHLFPKLQSRRDKEGMLYLFDRSSVERACERLGVPTPHSSTHATLPTSKVR